MIYQIQTDLLNVLSFVPIQPRGCVSFALAEYVGLLFDIIHLLRFYLLD